MVKFFLLFFLFIFLNNIQNCLSRQRNEDDIIDLPVSRFPHPICSYSVHKKYKNGTLINRFVFTKIQIKRLKNL